MTFDTACAAFRTKDLEQFDSAAEAVVQNARRGLKDREIELLAKSLAASGDNVLLPSELGPFIDVPSSGGPASLTTLLCPLLVAAFGFHVPKLSATGSIAGGIDTMGIIPGFRTDLSGKDFVAALRKAKFAHAEPSPTFCPADASLIRKRRVANMMANSGLATASLLAKKLATPNTKGMFDFRIGPAGNIGQNWASARSAKRLFKRIAGRLGLTVDVVLTENRTFPSSALGRIESLLLLWKMLSNDSLLDVDRDHLRLCVEISAKACLLADTRLQLTEITAKLERILATGGAKRAFLQHLKAQGATVAAFQAVLKWRQDQEVREIRSASGGYWIPPEINRSKEWLKQEQKRVQESISREAAHTQVGLRLNRSRGDLVRKGELVVEFRQPPNLPPPEIPVWLRGRILKSRPENNKG